MDSTESRARLLRHPPLVTPPTGIGMALVMAQAQRQIQTPRPHRPPLLPHALIQPTRRSEMQQTPSALRSGALLVLRQTVAMAVHHRNTATTQLQRRRRTVIVLPRRMTRVNGTPIYASEEIGQSRVTITRELTQLALPRMPLILPTRRDRSSIL